MGKDYKRLILRMNERLLSFVINIVNFIQCTENKF